MASAARSKVSSVFRSGLFKDKVAIVTGGGTGIGKGITKELLYLGRQDFYIDLDSGYKCTRFTYSAHDISVPDTDIAHRIYLYQVHI